MSLALFIGVPFLTHCLYKIKLHNSFWIAEWTAGDILSYYGSVLSFCATVILSLLAIWQNKAIQDESDKHACLLEEMENNRVCPFFVISLIQESIYHSDMHIAIKNVTENIALDVSLLELEGTLNRGECLKNTYGTLVSNESITVELKNGFLEETDKVKMNILCKDIYGNDCCFLIEGKYIAENAQFSFEALKKKKAHSDA